ncbi:protein FAM90A13-like [Marmota flaviventris]|uniref:protein FAM90A13-like n=1 Tax=Marmota flaviventris TaxID=93162 RepID=UPI003A834FE4
MGQNIQGLNPQSTLKVDSFLEDPTRFLQVSEYLRTIVPMQQGMRESPMSASEGMGPDLKKMRQSAEHASQPLAPSLIQIQNKKHQQRGAVGHRAPPPEEEDPRLKCKDCGAFGHTARSRRCPIKCWDGALAPQPLGPKKEKENQAPSKPRNLQNTGACEQPARMKGQVQRQEEERGKALLQTGSSHRRPQERQQPKWKEETEPSAYLRKPSRPLPVHTTRTRCVLGSGFESQPCVQSSDESLTFTSAHPFQRPKRGLHSGPGIQKKQDVSVPGTIHLVARHSGQNPGLLGKKAPETPEVVSSKVAQTSAKILGGGHVLHPPSLARCPDVSKEPCLQPAACPQGQGHKLSLQAPGKRQAQVHIQTGQNAPKKLRLGHSLTPRGNTCRPGSEARKSLPAWQDTSGIGLKGSPQVTRKSPAHDSSMDLRPPKESPFLNPVEPCTKSSPPAPSCVPRQPLRMLFKRMHKNWWRSRFIADLPSSPTAKTSALADTPPYLDESDSPSSHEPVSVLYEDLQVSSSSEDSDMEHRAKNVPEMEPDSLMRRGGSVTCVHVTVRLKTGCGAFCALVHGDKEFLQIAVVLEESDP